MKRTYIIIMLAIIGLSTCLLIGTVNAQTAYITNTSDNTVSVIDLATNTVTAYNHSWVFSFWTIY